MNHKSHTMSNPWLSLTVRLDRGGRIDSFRDLKRQREWVWHPPAYNAETLPRLNRGASFDENWTGGWDDIFPNDAAGPFRGRTLYDHGEVWSQALDLVEISPEGISMRFDCQSLPLSFEKTIVLEKDAPVCRIIHRIHNRSTEPQPFLFKQHPALSIEPGDEILMPGCELEPVALGFSRIAAQDTTTFFPYVLDAEKNPVRIDRMLDPGTQAREFLYAKNLAEPYCGLRHRASGSELLFEFDRQNFPFVWIFSSFNGFRDHYVLILEPCTTMPYDLERACQQKTCAHIDGKATLHYETRVRIQSS